MAVAQTRSTRAAHSLVLAKGPSALSAATAEETTWHSLDGGPTHEAACEESSPPPPLPRHDAWELAFARRALLRMVLDSRLFSPEAASSGWFRPAGEAEDAEGGAGVVAGTGTGGGDAGAPVDEEAAAEAETEAEEEAPAAAAPSPARWPREAAPVPAVRERDIVCGEVLGEGGFCEVRLATLRGFSDRG